MPMLAGVAVVVVGVGLTIAAALWFGRRTMRTVATLTVIAGLLVVMWVDDAAVHRPALAQPREGPCLRADQLALAGQTEQARTHYMQLMDADDVAEAAADCATTGLAALNTADTDALFRSRLDETVRRLFGGLLGLDRPLGPATFAVLGLLLLAAYRSLEAVNANRETPAIEVTGVTSAGDEHKAAAADAAARLRERLSTSGVATPPTIPGGDTSLTSLLETDPRSDPMWIGRVLAYAARVVAPVNAWRIEGVLRSLSGTDGTTPRYELIVIATRASRRTCLFVNSFHAPSPTRAAELTASYVAKRALDHAHGMPAWIRWRSSEGRGLDAFQRAIGARENDDQFGARRALLEAIRFDPVNPLPPLELAQLEEEFGDFANAISRYAAIVRDHGDLLEARYRLAAACSFAEYWLSGPLAASRWRLVRPALAQVEGFELPPADAPLPEDGRYTADTAAVPHAVVSLAARQLDELKACVSWRRLLRASRRRDFRRMRWPWLVPWRRDRRAFAAMVETARLIVELRRRQIHDASREGAAMGTLPTEASDLEQRLQRVVSRPFGWQPAYNAACFSAKLLLNEDAVLLEARRKEHNARYAAESVRYLQLALSNDVDPLPFGSRFWMLKEDPDLNELRHQPVFDEWKRRLPELATPALRFEIAALAHAARRCERVWRDRLASLSDDTTVRRYARWCTTEADVWSRLADWAQHPDDAARRAALDRAVAAMSPRGERPRLEAVALQDAAESHLEETLAALRDLAYARSSGWRRQQELAETAASTAFTAPDLEPVLEQATTTWSAVAAAASRPSDTATRESLRTIASEPFLEAPLRLSGSERPDAEPASTSLHPSRSRGGD